MAKSEGGGGYHLANLTGVVMAAVLAMIFLGLGTYVINQMGETGNITVLNQLSNTLGSWGTTWMPIILIVCAASIIIGLLVSGFGGR